MTSWRPRLRWDIFIGRIGCFFAGCCYGKQCSLPWAVTFRDSDSLAPLGVPLHPTQLYSSGSNLLIFLILLVLRRYRKFDGQIFWLYVALYGAARSLIEIFRGDFRGGEILGVLSPSQAVGGVMILLAIAMLVILAGKSAREKDSG